jgi:putative ABC transport system ATP-binding protein/lipoprotein-releasing system ATP-binding protein
VSEHTGSQLSLTSVTKSYLSTGQAVLAVADVTMSVRSGEFVSIVGHSGSGKSTLLSLMGAIQRPDSGTVVLDGTDLWSMSDARRSHLRNTQFAFVYQFASLVPTLTAEENVLLPTIFGGAANRSDAQRLLELVGLGNKLKRYPSELSGGEQQRVSIARSFINAPSFLLADEPTGDLDEDAESDIMALFERFNRDNKVTIIMVTHNSDLAARASRRFRMQHGALVEISHRG